ncbi:MULTISPECIES: hypothetical protein [Acetobacteraceae]|uniref:hypothetical protein n=1 Tax=Acetobacteraceae TaxID=433 RepID=UPI001C2DD59F|nr:MULTISPECIES: hypothetical protein [Acetobacteraceae]MBV1834439.1 hypothetical protein [Novacetimonas pomaceti]
MAMPRLPIPDSDHVVRYVSYTRQARDVDNKLIGNGLLWASLQQKRDETFVSVNWLEYHKKSVSSLSRDESLKLVRNDLASAFPPKPTSKALLAIGNVGQIKSTCAAAGAPVRITHEPTKNNPSHAGIRQLSTEENELLEVLATEVFIDTVLAATLI